MKKTIEFRKITVSEIDKAYSIICDAVDWLKSKNIKQWTEPYPLEKIIQHQKNGEAFGLFINNDIAVFMLLLKNINKEWQEETSSKEVWWLSKLATFSAFHHLNYGKIAVKYARDFLRDQEIDVLYLDCMAGKGFLENYYASLGFTIIHKKVIDWPKCGPCEMALMKCVL